jgi:hypothetical protein
MVLARALDLGLEALSKTPASDRESRKGLGED